MNKFSKLIFYVLVGSLLILTSSMSYDFIRRAMPAGQQILAFAALAAFGVGAVMWTMFFKGAAGWPRTVAGVFIGVDILGEGALFMADVYLSAASSFGLQELTPEAINIFLLAFGGVVISNVIAGVLCEVLEVESLEKAAEREQEIAEREADLEIRKIEMLAEIDNRRALAQAIKQRAKAYNAQRMPQLLEAWQTGAETRYSAVETALQAGYRPAQPGEVIENKEDHKGLLAMLPQAAKEKPAFDMATLAAAVAAIMAKPQPKTQPEPTYTPIGPAELRSYAAETTPPPAVRPLDPQAGHAK